MAKLNCSSCTFQGTPEVTDGSPKSLSEPTLAKSQSIGSSDIRNPARLIQDHQGEADKLEGKGSTHGATVKSIKARFEAAAASSDKPKVPTRYRPQSSWSTAGSSSTPASRSTSLSSMTSSYTPQSPNSGKVATLQPADNIHALSFIRNTL